MGSARTPKTAKMGDGGLYLLIGLSLVAPLAMSCSRQPSVDGETPCEEVRSDGAPGPTGVVLIINDTMRRDRMGAYGGPARTPAFDGFARANLLFDRAFTQSPWTKPSIATLFTSLYPSQHGVAHDPQLRNPNDTARTGPIEQADVLSSDFTTLAEVLKGRGYRTAAFVSNPWLEKRFGFGQGFDVYDDSFARWGVPGAVISRAALEWLQQLEPGDHFLLYLHYLDSHLPYGLLERDEVMARAGEIAGDHRPLSDNARLAVQLVPRFEDGQPAVAAGLPPALQLVEMAYDRGLENFDLALQEFLAGFTTHWSYATTAVIVTADHGEALFTRGYGNHGTGLFDDEVSVPLAARFPGTRAAAPHVGCVVGLVDVLPTLCTYLGVPCPEPVFGTSFVASSAPQGTRAARFLATEGVVNAPEHRAIRNRQYKLMWERGRRADGSVRDNPYSLYEVGTDAAESRDLLIPAYHTAAIDRVLQVMSAALPTAVPAFTPPKKDYAPLGGELQERLKSLGYTN